ncbi:hypothetical protein [Bosea sp. ASV33]|uniref:hypothetical protein n=1 Tax=Bosea sp. ASV33 TaxID=2795106 RepID=UPI0018EA73D7|nr:hypothetical protein [Bosea sp. ASV33]
MAKKVKFKSGLEFSPLRAAVLHVYGIMREHSEGSAIPEPHASDLLDMYRRYCDVTGRDDFGVVAVRAMTSCMEFYIKPGQLKLVACGKRAWLPINVSEAIFAIATE